MPEVMLAKPIMHVERRKRGQKDKVAITSGVAPLALIRSLKHLYLVPYLVPEVSDFQGLKCKDD